MAKYRRDPRAALTSMMDMTLEERGAYNTVLDLIHEYGGSIIDDDRYLAGWCRCDVRVWRRLRRRLIDKGKIRSDGDSIFDAGEIASQMLGDDLRLSGQAWAAIRTRVFERDNYTCQYCGARGGKLECDHVHPVSRGGSNDEENLTTACFTCNRSKRAKTVDEWLAENAHG